ncbi:MAG: filamentous hemagglutinin N-terminal domain-containing protein, partial [Ectothiorhodospiraceae bacterium]|nr:filamentous hemagglutinin N-terminal domain-containing protein [Ectothiorhodospiraceae bacterium]
MSGRRATRRAIAVLGLLASANAGAQVVTDGTVGPGRVIPGPDHAIPHTLGARIGGNLFHSFTRFDLPTGTSATFSGPGGIAHVLARVTGGSASSIDGRLSATIPGADLWLVNPAGVLFGPNASLDLGGGFHVAGADHVTLADGGRFDAADPTRTRLTAAAPAAFGFLGPGGPVTVDRATLRVPDGRTLDAVGGSVTIDHGRLVAADGAVRIAAASTGAIAVDAPDLVRTESTELGDITVREDRISFRANVDASGAGGGRVHILAGRLWLDGGQVQSVVNVGGPGDGGPVRIEATGQVRADGVARVDTRTFGAGNGGHIVIDAPSIDLAGSTQLTTDTHVAGDAGDITVTADRLALREASGITADALGPGHGGNIAIRATRIDLDGDVFVSARTAFEGSGNAGTVLLSAETLRTAGTATVDTSSFAGSAGDGGSIVVDVRDIAMREESWLISNTLTDGDGGRIEVRDARILDMADRTVIATTSFGAGAGGDVRIDADVVRLAGEAVISSGTEVSGAGGDVTITAATAMTMTGDARVSSQVVAENQFVRDEALVPIARPGTGDAGDVFIDTATLALGGRAQISSATASVAPDPGDGGDVTIAVARLTVADDARISASSTGRGLAGTVTVLASELARLVDGGAITTEALGADGGDIVVNVGTLLYLRDGAITTSVSDGDGDGGNIDIDPVFVVLDGGRIVANAFGGRGGNIRIVTEHLIADPTSRIDASSALGIDGEVVIESPNEDVASTLVTLPSAFVSAEALVAQACAERTRADVSRLLVRGRDASPLAPDDLLPSALPAALRYASAPQARSAWIALAGSCG